ncbi:hypothetical protein SDC9_195702 [bioreactor metagenome]|uniref:Uncharacterized protein n=1 Tax=bioreactor metagenome TaxID=1076179 RepID=A0A645IA19_9ZZZZ
MNPLLADVHLLGRQYQNLSAVSGKIDAALLQKFHEKRTVYDAIENIEAGIRDLDACLVCGFPESGKADLRIGMPRIRNLNTSDTNTRLRGSVQQMPVCLFIIL